VADPPFASSKNFQKKVKKSLPAFGKSNKRGKVEDKSADFPFKNIFKKVKKKLVSLSNIQ